MSYSSLNSSKAYISNDSHLPKSFLQKEITLNEVKKLSSNIEQSRLSLSMIWKEKSPDEYPSILKEMGLQMESVFQEIQRVAYISEELMKENSIWKEEYQKLKLSLDPNLKNENYERNFIRRLADLKTSVAKKEEEINKKIIILKKMENENTYLKKELDLKNNNNLNSSLMKNDLKNKLYELEARNAVLIKEINNLRIEPIHEDHHKSSPQKEKE